MHYELVAHHCHRRILLLDSQEPAVTIHDNKIDLAVHGIGLVNARPVNAMKDGVLRR